MSSIHLILNPPLAFSHSVNAAWISLVLSSLGNPVSDRMRVTQAESWDSEVDISSASEYDEVARGLMARPGAESRLKRNYTYGE